jgi:hypothetical protein
MSHPTTDSLSPFYFLKGQGAKIIIAEECALIPLAVFFEVICPMLLLDESALICIR